MLIIDWIKQIKIFSTLKFVLSWIWNLLITFLTIDVKMWLILVILSSLMLIIWIVLQVIAKQTATEPEWMKYTEDRFVDWKWSWKWEKNYLGAYEISQLMAHCPKCNTPMRHDNDEYTFHCPRCKYESHKHQDNRHDVMVVIYDNVARMEKRNKAT